MAGAVYGKGLIRQIRYQQLLTKLDSVQLQVFACKYDTATRHLAIFLVFLRITIASVVLPKVAKMMTDPNYLVETISLFDLA